MKPTSIEQISDNVIAIKWNNDQESILFAEKVRKSCPCASCRDEKQEKGTSPFKILKSNPNAVIFKNWEYVGNYAVRFGFSDNHTTGIYTYEYLTQIGE